MSTRQVAIDSCGVAHAVAIVLRLWEHPTSLSTKCGITLSMEETSRLNGQVNCMACLVAEARQ